MIITNHLGNTLYNLDLTSDQKTALCFFNPPNEDILLLTTYSEELLGIGNITNDYVFSSENRRRSMKEILAKISNSSMKLYDDINYDFLDHGQYVLGAGRGTKHFAIELATFKSHSLIAQCSSTSPQRDLEISLNYEYLDIYGNPKTSLKKDVSSNVKINQIISVPKFVLSNANNFGQVDIKGKHFLLEEIDNIFGIFI